VLVTVSEPLNEFQEPTAGGLEIDGNPITFDALLSPTVARFAAGVAIFSGSVWVVTTPETVEFMSGRPLSPPFVGNTVEP
jgi:hypothetical protein